MLSFCFGSLACVSKMEVFCGRRYRDLASFFWRIENGGSSRFGSFGFACFVFLIV